MATNLEKLRAKKAENKTREANLTTSFTIDEGVPISETLTKEASVLPTAQPDSVIQPTKNIDNNNREDRGIEPSKPNNAIKDSKPINHINSMDSIRKSEDPERNLGLRLSSDDDKKYLNMAPLSRSMTKKAFFINLMEQEFSRNEDIDLNDPQLDAFRNSSLKTTAITIAVPESLIQQIKASSAKYMIKYQRYVAYAVHKARLSDEWWQKNMS